MISRNSDDYQILNIFEFWFQTRVFFCENQVSVIWLFVLMKMDFIF